jgi:GT2 family glycosyltransferase
VIIVNYGTPDLAIEAVESVRERNHGGRDLEINVVDNASPGGDAAILLEAHRKRGWGGEVTLHLEKENHGFGRGNNVVLRMLAKRDHPPEKVFLLNPDARLENEAIDILATFLDNNPKVGAAGCAISLPDGTAASAAFRFPTIWSELDRAASFGPLSRALRNHHTALAPNLPTQRVDWVVGAAVMLRFRAIEEACFFDPAYFLYFEEVDLMYSLAQSGWETWFVATGSVTHTEGAATGVGSRMARKRQPAYLYNSWRHYFLKNHGRTTAIAGAALMLIGGTLHIVTSRLRGREPLIPLNYFGDTLRHVVLPLLFGERERRISRPDARAL